MSSVGCSTPVVEVTGTDSPEVTATSLRSELDWCARNKTCGSSRAGALPKYGRIEGTVRQKESREACSVKMLIRPLYGSDADGAACDPSYKTMQDVAAAGSGERLDVEINVAVRCESGFAADALFRQHSCEGGDAGPFAKVQYPAADGSSVDVKAKKSDRAEGDYLSLRGIFEDDRPAPRIDPDDGDLVVGGVALQVNELSFALANTL